MAEKPNPRNLHRIRTRHAAVRGIEWELLQVVLGLAYTVQEQTSKTTTKPAQSDSLAEGLHPALQRIAACAQNLTEATGAAIALGGPNAMVCVARSGQSAPPIGARFDASSGLSGECIRTGEYAICVNAAADPRVNYQACRTLNVASMLYFPLHSAQGKIIGILGVFASRPLHFSQRDITSLRFTEGLVQEAIGRSANDPDPATLRVLLRRADFDINDEPAEVIQAPKLEQPVIAAKMDLPLTPLPVKSSTVSAIPVPFPP
ncbi:MAG TPA: GAF domain-containing protein, partial [Terriglobales bacterium]|nr:GAF domain-containing protein [Terriglobales bacterium]